jgi:hypothetical protein
MRVRWIPVNGTQPHGNGQNAARLRSARCSRGRDDLHDGTVAAMSKRGRQRPSLLAPPALGEGWHCQPRAQRSRAWVCDLRIS